MPQFGQKCISLAMPELQRGQREPDGATSAAIDHRHVPLSPQKPAFRFSDL